MRGRRTTHAEDPAEGISGPFGLKQEDLANLVGVRRETIGNLENGRYNPSLKLAMDIAKVFHTTVEELFLLRGGVRGVRKGADTGFALRVRCRKLSG